MGSQVGLASLVRWKFRRLIRRCGGRSQQRMPIQILENAKDSITSLVIQNHVIVTGSVDGHVRTYDIRQGELRTDLFDRKYSPSFVDVWR